MKERASTPELQQLVEFIDRQWFRNSVIGIADWSIFRRKVRTKNDVEGWHNRLNTAAEHGGVPFYVLVQTLNKEAQILDISVRSEDLDRDTNRRYTTLETKIQTAWDSYMTSEMTTTHFLKTISNLYRPADIPKYQLELQDD